MARLNKLHPRITDERHVAAAKALYNEEGILEVDRGALVSHSEEGAYYGGLPFPRTTYRKPAITACEFRMPDQQKHSSVICTSFESPDILVARTLRI